MLSRGDATNTHRTPSQAVTGRQRDSRPARLTCRARHLCVAQVTRPASRTSEPSACLIDSQSIKTSATVPLTSQGIDPAKKIIGRKRHIVTDALGLLLAVTAAGVHDSAAGTQLLAKVAAHHPTVTKAGADNGCKTKAVEHAAHHGIDLETHPHRSAAMIQLAAINLMTRRLTHEATHNWRAS